MKLPLYLYFDNGLFRKLISEVGKDVYDSFFNSIFGESYTEYLVIFTWFSLLEGAALGRLKKEQKNGKWKRLNWDKDSYREELKEAPEKVLLEYFEKSKKNYLEHPLLKENELTKKIEAQISRSKKPHTKKLIEDTLERRLEEIKKDYDKCAESIARALAWDDTCIQKFINYEQESKQECARNSYRDIRRVLLNFFRKANIEGEVLNSYRLMETIVKELMTTDEQKNEYKEKMGFDVIKFIRQNSLDSRNDMCDVEVIHFATLGFYDKKKGTIPVIVVTCDKPVVLKNRLAIQQVIIPNLENLNMRTGKIYSVANDLLTIEEISVTSNTNFILPID